ncbi:MAG: HAMP domain-containing histidine kinase [Cyanosarcina radialis HA8281-LM2]|nr:HAMP domain-containing histidine kinase [Cyanosarcina radialis HA8281-LM2]
MKLKWLLPTLSEILTRNDRAAEVEFARRAVAEDRPQLDRRPSRTASKRVKAEREWSAGIAALEALLLQQLGCHESDRSTVRGLVLTGPVPLLSHPAAIANYQTGIFTVEAFPGNAFVPFQLPPANHTEIDRTTNVSWLFPLLPVDPLAAEQFCLVFAANFSLIMVLGEDANGVPAFKFSFDPADVELAWRSLKSRVPLATPLHWRELDSLVKQFPAVAPDYRTVMEFSRQLLDYLPEEANGKESECSHPSTSTAWIDEIAPNPSATKPEVAKAADVELLQALTHEIRTPLTTIRTLTRLVLKRRDLAPDIAKRLEIIDRECTEQINRMELIFQAVELATSGFKTSPVHLTATSLDGLLEQCIPRWQTQALRHNVTLDVVLPQKLPAVASNPALLERVLTGTIENFTRSLSTGGHIQLEVTRAGDRLKLQFQSQPHPQTTRLQCKSIGQLLTFQPETGSLSLNLNVTKNLFQALGGKLIVRERPQQGEVMTVFLPLEVNNKVGNTLRDL